jgi:hypothetical protein
VRTKTSPLLRKLTFAIGNPVHPLSAHEKKRGIGFSSFIAKSMRIVKSNDGKNGEGEKRRKGPKKEGLRRKNRRPGGINQKDIWGTRWRVQEKT